MGGAAARRALGSYLQQVGARIRRSTGDGAFEAFEKSVSTVGKLTRMAAESTAEVGGRREFR